MAVLLLVERGQLDLDEDVRTYLPEVPRYRKRRPIRLTDLLRHSSGLPDYSSIWHGAAREARLTNERYLKRLIKHPLDFFPGTKTDYSNSNYILLALIIERLSGQTFRQFMQQEIFQPLGMEHSYIHDTLNVHIPHRARGYIVNKAGRVKKSDIPIVLVGHSHLFSSITDLARWEKELHAPRLIPARTLARAFTTTHLDNGKKNTYSFGWYQETHNGRRAFVHGGSWYGFSNYVCRYLKDHLTVAVLSNNESLDAERLATRLAGLYFREGTRQP
jgi:CubicO group peptidase (beta-lactamase class C family)